MLELLSSKSSGEKKKKPLLNVKALSFYEKDCIISSRGKWKTVKQSSFRKCLPLQTHLPAITTMTGDCHQGLPTVRRTVLTSPLRLFLVAVFGVRTAKLFLTFYIQFNIEHNVSLSFF